MLTVNFTRVKIRPKPSLDRVQQSHCAITAGTTSAYATGTTDADSQAAARQLLSVHVFAMSAKESKEFRPTYLGFPSHYRLARGVS